MTQHLHNVASCMIALKRAACLAEMEVIGQSHPSPRPSPREGRGRRPGSALLLQIGNGSPSPLNGERAGVRGAVSHGLRTRQIPTKRPC